MAKWLYDPVASQYAGELRFRLPFPRSNWREERYWNAFLLDAMRLIWVADQVFEKDSETWNKPEREFYKAYLKDLKRFKEGRKDA